MSAAGVVVAIDYMPLLFAVGTYVLMLVAFFSAKIRFFHVPVMLGCFVFDLLMPFYLYMTRDWYFRLIEQQEMFSFMIWMHLMLVISLYFLYVLQIRSALKMIKGEEQLRVDHRAQGKGVLIARGLVILSAAMLIEPIPVAD